ncbi:Lrp/AsnC family transcriptional regulator [Gammaproteobacteria bacterium AS21]|jgi:DNA-binding Lrp family transcriptional regulator
MSNLSPQELPSIKLTNKDRQLLELLKINARESNASLARKIGVSRATVQERISRLEAAGIIEGYSANINEQKLQNSKNIEAVVMMLVENKAFNETFIALEEMPNIVAIHSLSGEWDWALLVSAPSIDEFHQCITDINQLAGVKATVSHIIMKTRLDRRKKIKNGF